MAAPEDRVQCDVLVIGGGAAGLAAAIEARRRGADVLVVNKGKSGRSGNTTVAGALISVVLPFEGSEDSPDLHFQDSLNGGQGINDEKLLRILVDRGGERVLKLEEWGARLLRAEGKLVRRRPPEHSQPRGLTTEHSAYPRAIAGLSITLPLQAVAQRASTRFLDGMPVLRLLKGDEGVCGALALDLEGGRPVQIEARAVIVAAGGGGQIFANNSNVRGICGDSYGMLLQAGATLRDMEFVQFYPCHVAAPARGLGIPTSMFTEGAVLRNRHGERFMSEAVPRDAMSQGMYFELRKGNGIDGHLYVDATGVPEAALEGKYATVTRDLRKRGIDPARDWIKVGMTTHFTMGGAVVDDRCRTGVPGLFAAGEAVGGVHGANRLSGNALPEALVFGAVAGAAAAEHVSRLPGVPEPSGASLTLETEGSGRESLDEVRAELRRAMWTGAGIVRSEASLQAALSVVRACAAQIERCPASSVAHLARREETRMMAVTAEVMVLSALLRRESRGAHFREDFPASEGRWLGSHQTRWAGDRLEVNLVPKG